MLTAVDDCGVSIYASGAVQGGGYFCPACHEAVTVKQGRIVTHHFAHRPGSDCVLSVGESVRHMRLKLLCLRLFEHADPHTEVEIGSRRADVLLGSRFVVECQVSPISIEEWNARTREYNRMGHPVLWLWDVKRVCGQQVLPEARELSTDPEWEPRVPVEIRHCHAKSYGHLYCADPDGLAACHLRSAHERVSAGGEDYPDRYYTPRTLKQPEFVTVQPLRMASFRGADGHWLGGFSEGTWWK